MNNEELLKNLANKISEAAGIHYQQGTRGSEYEVLNLTPQEVYDILLAHGVCFTLTSKEIETLKDLAAESINKVSYKQAEINNLEEENNKLREKLDKINDLSARFK